MRGAFAGGGGTLLAAELLGALSLVLWSLAFGVTIFVPAKRLGILRIPEDFEVTGIDIAELGRPAYSLRDAVERRRTPQSAVGRPISVSPVDSVESNSLMLRRILKRPAKGAARGRRGGGEGGDADGAAGDGWAVGDAPPPP